MRHFLHRLHVRLNCFLGRYAVSGEHRYLRMRVKELEEGENQDIRFLRFQLTRLRAEKNELLSRADDLRDKFSALFCMTVEQLQDAACRYDIWEADCGPGWFVAADHCAFCGCGLDATGFRTQRVALLYAALLQTVGYRPKHNLACPSCYDEYMKSCDLVEE